MYTKGDFHIHSIYSDGSLTPSQVVRLAKEKQVDIMAITDHNNTDGVDEAIIEGRKNNIFVIPGVELSTKYNDCKVHVLGYFKDDSYRNDLLKEILSNVKRGRIKEIRKIFKDKIDFCGFDNRLCTQTGVDILRFFGATVVLAHPVLLCKRDFDNIININFDGIEAKYFKNTENDTKYFIDIANKRKMIYTAGSDFHNYIESYRLHGMIGDVYLNNKEIEKFLKVLN
ncbi:PHP domain-containing protein [Clostridium sp.]|jgi:predicted metal-dependent phosphoesterase TrpH|uniref:PHP domain-containing protein n=1 Tax=Clostridium sp. TaxID=1506 RepID=UPI0025C3149B|nr:PHP domain-containing protein [Clostridium sp.]MCI9070301.1 PHP domain-containing protein [Clostridium sp.]